MVSILLNDKRIGIEKMLEAQQIAKEKKSQQKTCLQKKIEENQREQVACIDCKSNQKFNKLSKQQICENKKTQQMYSQNDVERKCLKQKKKLKILAIGDSHIGKTTFLKNYCSQQYDLNYKSNDNFTQQKVNKTIGCDIHVCYHTPNTKALITETKQNDSLQYQEEYTVQFIDMAGENKQREFLNVFIRNKLQKLDAILFFFDLTNLNTFKNFYKWLMAIFHNSQSKKDYACVWQIPFLLIGTKTDQIPSKYQAQIKQKLLNQLNKMFKCTRGENLIFLNANNIESSNQKVEMSMFHLFLSEICIEKTMKNMKQSTNSSLFSFQGQSEYNPQELLSGLNKNTQKYCLNNDNYKNKRIIEEDKNFMQIVLEVNQFSEYKKAWQNQVFNLTSRVIVIKERITEIIYTTFRKSEDELVLPHSNLE
ncbi:miro-like protein (macronuclear) [Tetrahymena thermophila SB210]|uniref:Miro-like protein n=2 Tax=Tetrahymena thermophila TaxID=5911 RepID=I7M5Y0_TETTS|nr:miro-like protein [Tetrahymena thermophila SB210]EAR83787.1 miro-like protein [Tetrahymena thermophila SB210]|eukprot:XP_001031450.1 miro-like protein [Tetrahymena thermophila SB210]